MRICQPPILRGELLVSGPVIQVPLFSFYGVTYIVYHHNNPSRTHPPQNAPPSRAISGTRDALEGDRGNDLVPGSFQKTTQVVSPSTSYSLDGGHPTAT